MNACAVIADGAGQTTAYAANTGVVYDAEKAEEPDTQFMSALALSCCSTSHA